MRKGTQDAVYGNKDASVNKRKCELKALKWAEQALR